MANFVDFIDNGTGGPVSINPEHVIKVRPMPDDPNNITVIRLRDSHEVGVKGKYVEVVKKLSVV
jgi:hypothetical protein